MILRKSQIAVLLPIAVAVIAATVLLTGLSPSAPAPPAVRFPLTLTDDLGRDVTLDSPPKRVISLVPSNAETVFAIGAGSKLIGVDRFTDFPPEVKDLIQAGKLSVVGGGFDPDLEKIITLKPDLILANGPSQRRVLAKLEDLGLKVIYLNPKDLEDLYAKAKLLGRALDASSGADQLVRSIQARVEEVSKKVQGLTKVSIYMEVWNNPLMSTGPRTISDTLIELAGGINVFADSPEKGKSLVISAEAVIERNPDVIVLVHKGNSVDEVKARPGWSVINAVRSGRVYQIDGKLVSPIPRVVEGIEVLARFLHPGSFR